MCLVMCLSHGMPGDAWTPSRQIVSSRDLRSTGSLTEGPGGGAAWLWSSSTLCPSSEMGFLVAFGEETSLYWDMEPTEVWRHGQACFVSFLPFSISLTYR